MFIIHFDGVQYCISDFENNALFIKLFGIQKLSISTLIPTSDFQFIIIFVLMCYCFQNL